MEFGFDDTQKICKYPVHLSWLQPLANIRCDLLGNRPCNYESVM